jgi:hypothetical protein
MSSSELCVVRRSLKADAGAAQVVEQAVMPVRSPLVS